MFQTICSKCGNKCEVPFRPTGDRPVFCNSCFKSQKNASFDKTKGGDQFKAQFDMLNVKLDKILAALETKKTKSALIKTKAVPKKATAKRKK